MTFVEITYGNNAFAFNNALLQRLHAKGQLPLCGYFVLDAEGHTITLDNLRYWCVDSQTAFSSVEQIIRLGHHRAKYETHILHH